MSENQRKYCLKYPSPVCYPPFLERRNFTILKLLLLGLLRYFTVLVESVPNTTSNVYCNLLGEKGFHLSVKKYYHTTQYWLKKLMPLFRPIIRKTKKNCDWFAHVFL